MFTFDSKYIVQFFRNYKKKSYHIAQVLNIQIVIIKDEIFVLLYLEESEEYSHYFIYR